VFVYRLTSRRFPICNGQGAKVYGGRWNSPGLAAVYTASTQSLAALEILAHTAALSDDYVAIRIEIPADVFIEHIQLADLPDWKTETTRSRGDAWLAEEGSVAVCVPSKVIPVEFNYVLNPIHRDFKRLIIYDPEPFRFDRRLLDRFINS